ncbi:MAG TPA: hypothetical protein DHV36_05095, partial [Desulfobacteraceae bacterium]|nr:hypothetical protein [Desulfobacteraceae bacterium]
PIQETGPQPLKLVGSYARAGRDLLIIVRLRRMGDAASQDLAVVQGTVPRTGLDRAWLAPRFDRMARTLVRLLESDYTGMQSLTISTQPFRPGNPAKGDLMLGREVAKYMTDALASSYVFQNAGTSFSPPNALLTGEYRQVSGHMVFHAAVKDRLTGKKLSGASFDIPMERIPPDLLALRIQTLDDLAEQTARALVLAYGQRNDGPAGTVFVGRHSFPDARSEAMVPLSLLLSEKFKTLLSGYRQFSVTDDPAADSDLRLSGNILKGDTGLTLAVALEKMEITDRGMTFNQIASVQETLDSRYCREHWFDFTMQGKIAFFLNTLVEDSLNALPQKERADIQIHRFTLRDSRYYSSFSDILNTRILDYFSGSRFFVPVMDTAARMDRLKSGGAYIPASSKVPGTVEAAMVNAPYFLRGSFRPTTRGGVSISASLAATDGRILASASTKIPAYLTDRDTLEPVADERSRQEIDLFEAPLGKTAGLKLMTQKGRNNVSFKRGETVSFFVRSDRNVYLNIFAMDAERTIYRIFPNRFTGTNPQVLAGRVTAIPDGSYADNFSFRVEGSLGNELVFAFASDRPLPELPGSIDTGFYGMTRIGLDVKEIKQWFADHAARYGAELIWDALPMLTRP